MPKFTGTFKEFNTYIGGWARNQTQKLTKKYKTGICANCGKQRTSGDETQSAHITGKDRLTVMEEIYNNIVSNKKSIDLNKFANEFNKYHSNPNNFHFLCEKCHNLYGKEEINEKDFKFEADSKK